MHTILRCEHLSLRTVLVVAPLNTLLNWISEFVRWVPDDADIKVDESFIYRVIIVYNSLQFGTNMDLKPLRCSECYQ